MGCRHLFQGFKPYLILSLLCLGVLIPGLAQIPPLDRDESRFAQATRQMLESGDYIRIMYQDEARNKKPVGIYWAQAASVAAFSSPASTAIWPYRLPSLLSVWLGVLLLYHFGKRLTGPPAALLGAGVLASSLMVILEGHQAKTDAALMAVSIAVMGSMGWFYLHGRGKAIAQPGNGVALAFWLALGLGMLIKGPVLPMIVAVTLAALAIADRNLAWFVKMRPLMGLLVASAIVGPWLVSISSATGGAFMGEAVGKDLLPKLLGAQESHGGVPGMYLLLASIFLWPGSLLLWPALSRALRERAAPHHRFLLAWLVPSWLIFELIPTKLPHYVLPLYPALALLIAAWAFENQGKIGKGLKAWAAVWGLIGLILAAASVAAPILYGSGFTLWSIPAALAALLASALAIRHLWTGHHAKALIQGGLAGALAITLILAAILPRLDQLAISRRAAEAVAAQGATLPVAAAGYHEPSLVFWLGTRTLLADGGKSAAEHILAHQGALALVEEREEIGFRAALGLSDVEELAKIEGINYSRGKPVTLRLYRAGKGG
ncbi:MAG: glycosyltransferase family 39 protein [Alphaproteobacteria bacterium]|nr:glycosyltransferase family 39 protein [Alphaproteobacteria bacterium]